MAAGGKQSGAKEKKGSDQVGGFSKSFDQYEYVAVITPGAALLLGLVLIFPNAIPVKPGADIGLGPLGFFLIASYVAGHILRAIGDVVERIYWRCIVGGMPSDWVLREAPAGLIDKTLLDQQQKDELVERIKKQFNVDFDKLVITQSDDCTSRARKFEEWQSVTRQIAGKVSDAKKGGRVNAFNRTYGMMVGITVATVILAVTIWEQGWFIDNPWPNRAVLSSIAGTVAIFTAYRAFIFGKLYARELFISYLNLPKPK